MQMVFLKAYYQRERQSNVMATGGRLSLRAYFLLSLRLEERSWRKRAYDTPAKVMSKKRACRADKRHTTFPAIFRVDLFFKPASWPASYRPHIGPGLAYPDLQKASRQTLIGEAYTTMKLGLTTFLLAAGSAAAFAPAASTNGAGVATSALTPQTTTSALSLSSATEAAPFAQGPRIVRDELPIVYVYDHCPFCVRVRLALGIMNVKHNVHFLGNDDIATPTKLVGKKIAPIFVSPIRRRVSLLQHMRQC